MEINATNILGLEHHRYASIFPDMGGEDFSYLVASIKKLGRLRYPIIIYEGQILDGRHRLKACRIAKVDPRWIAFKGTDQQALELVWDMNAPRRNMNPSQRAVAFTEYVKFADIGRPEKSVHVNTLNEAATKAGVGKSTIRRAKSVVEHGTKKDIESIKRGETTVAKIAFRIQSESKNGAEDVDASGYAVPAPALPYWRRKAEAEEILNFIRSAKKKVNALDKDDPMWRKASLNGVLADLDSAINRFRGGVPAHVCGHCDGKKPIGCEACNGIGVVSEFFWRQCVPEEKKEQRKKNVS